MLNPRHLRAPALAVALLAVTAGAALANPASDHLSTAASTVGSKLNAAWAQANADAQAAIAAARQRILDQLAATGASAPRTSADAADPLAAAQAGLTKAIDALDSNSTDADSGGLDGLNTAWSAVTSGLENAAAGSAHAGSHTP